jgi:hypothetical protein
MNTLSRLMGFKGEARVRYLDAEFKAVEGSGDFVRCAVTGKIIPLVDLKYWSVERQEAYIDATASLQRHLEVKTKGKG